MVHRVIKPQSNMREDVQSREEKKKRIVIGATFAGVFLFVFLLVVLIFQFVRIGNEMSINKSLTKESQRYEQLTNETEKTLEFYKTEDGLRMWAVLNGYKSKTSK